MDYSASGLIFDSPKEISGWTALNVENVETTIFFDLDNLIEDIPNLDSLSIKVDFGKADLLGRASEVEGELDMDLREMLDKV